MSILDDTPSVLAILDTTTSISAPLSDPSGIDATILDALRSCGVELPDIPPPFEPSILVPLGQYDVHDATSCVDGIYMVPLDFLMNPDPDTIDTIGTIDVDSKREVRRLVPARIPTAPYSMGLSFERSGWQAPGYRHPIVQEMEAVCVDPKLLIRIPTPPPSPLPLEPVHDADLEDAAEAFLALQVAGAAHEDDESGDESEPESDSDSDGDDDALDSDFEERPKLQTRARAIRPLPRRVTLKVSLPPSTCRAASLPTPAPATAASPSKKRKAVRTAGPRATKQAAVASPTSDVPAAVPVLLGCADPPAAVRGVPAHYEHLSELGCTLLGRGMLCNIDGCTQRTSSIADMGRHIRVHIPQRLSCDGCPQTYSRPDSLKRHVHKNRSGGHCSDARVEFLATFNELPAVLKVRAGRMAGTTEVAMNKELNKMFNALFAASKARKT
ncbi:hypothetical protein C8R44DRAFT_871825 [Mycena epipterygia]|nr:hypothetical protein C8R44DRAFT_871825 [Mycena epipterygia]